MLQVLYVETMPSSRTGSAAAYLPNPIEYNEMQLLYDVDIHHHPQCILRSRYIGARKKWTGVLSSNLEYSTVVLISLI